MTWNTALLQRQEPATLPHTLSSVPPIRRTSTLTGRRYTSVMDGVCSFYTKTIPHRVKILKKGNTHFQQIHELGASPLS